MTTANTSVVRSGFCFGDSTTALLNGTEAVSILFTLFYVTMFFIIADSVKFRTTFIAAFISSMCPHKSTIVVDKDRGSHNVCLIIKYRSKHFLFVLIGTEGNVSNTILLVGICITFLRNIAGHSVDRGK